MKTVGTKLDNSEYEEFESKCSECGLSKSEKLRELVKGFIKKPNQSEPKLIQVTDIDEEKPSPKLQVIRID